MLYPIKIPQLLKSIRMTLKSSLFLFFMFMQSYAAIESLKNLAAQKVAHSIERYATAPLVEEMQKLILPYLFSLYGPLPALLLKNIHPYKAPISAIDLREELQKLLVGFSNGRLYLINLTNNEITWTNKNNYYPLTVAIESDQKCIFTGWGTKAAAWHVIRNEIEQNYNKSCPAPLYLTRQNLKGTLFTSNDIGVITTNEQYEIIISKPFENKKSIFAGHTDHVIALAFNRGKTRVASLSCDKTIRIWDIAAASCRHKIELSEHICVEEDDINPKYFLHLNDTGTYLTFGMNDGAVSIWRLIESKTIAQYIYLHSYLLKQNPLASIDIAEVLSTFEQQDQEMLV